MITKLTEQQKSQLIEYRNEMLRYGRCTNRSDCEVTEKHISFLYQAIEKRPPRFFWFDGPFSGIIAIELMRKKGSNLWSNLESNLRSNLRSNLWSNLESNLWSNLRSNLESNLRSNLELNLGSNLWSNLESNLESNLRSNLELNLGSNLELNLGSNLRSNLRSNLWSNLESNLRSNLESNLNNMFWGQHELAWIAFYDFCNLIGVKYEKENREILDTWLGIVKSTGWWCPFENICFCFERPNRCCVDKRGRLHCNDGPALSFRDNHALYYWHGKEIPKEIIEGKGDLRTKIESWVIFNDIN